MREARAWAKRAVLITATLAMVLAFCGAAYAAPVPKRAPGGVETASLSGAYPGYIYLTSHANGATYSYVQGTSIYVTCRATDYNSWNFYKALIGVWDTSTSSYAKIIWASSYVAYSGSYYATIDTSGFAPSSGRYQVQVVLWDDVYSAIEDLEYFNLTVSAPHTVSATISQVSPSPAIQGSSVSFSGYGSDSSGHSITGYQWRSNIDGVISTTASFSTSSLSAGTHTIYFKTLCANGTWSPEVSRSLTVNAAPDTVGAAIDAVSPNPATAGSSVSFSGHGSDSRGHSITGYQWRSSINGVISTSASFSTSSLSAGTHTIYFRAQCANGTWSPEVSTSLTVRQAQVDAPTAVIDLASPNPATAGASVSLSGHGVDALGHGFIAYQWRSSIDGVFAASNAVSTTSLSAGTHTIYFRAQCANGTWSPEVTLALTVNVGPATVYTPVAPTTMYHGRTATVYGYVAPAHGSGTYLATLQFYLRNSKGVYVYHHSVSAKRYNYSSAKSKYLASVALPHAGKWRVRAYHADSGHAPSYSGWRYVTVK